MRISINTSDIEEIKCDDGVTRSHIDTAEKLIRLIKSEFKRLEYKSKEDNKPLSYFKQINLTKCIINIGFELGPPSLCNILEKLKPDEKQDFFEKSDCNGTTLYVIKKKVTYVNCEIRTGNFKNVTFLEDVRFDNSHFLNNASFYNCQFRKSTFFQEVTFEKGLDFGNSIFNGNVVFSNSKIKGCNIDFKGCVFKEKFRAQGLELSSPDENFTPYIDFSKGEFYKDVDLSYIDFNRACSFANTKILGDISFRKSHFRVSVDFYAMKLEGNMLFSSYPEEENEEEITPNIIKQILFKRAMINGRIDFEKCEIDLLEASFADIQKDALFRIYESKIKRLDFTSVYNDGVIMLEDNQDNIEEITFKSALNTGLIEIENSNTKTIKDRKTARLLKDSANKSGNTIDALHYKAKEMALYQKELISKIKPSLGLKTLLSNLLNSIKRKIILSVLFAIPTIIIALISHQILYPLIAFLILSVFIWTSVGSFLNEIIVLILNTISNKNGLSWIRGVLFTLTVWVLFYGLFIMSRDGIGDVFFLSIEANREGFIDYLWLPSGLNNLLIDNIVISWFTSVIFVLGKIAIAYGIYQTITAFRKYKN